MATEPENPTEVENSPEHGDDATTNATPSQSQELEEHADTLMLALSFFVEDGIPESLFVRKKEDCTARLAFLADQDKRVDEWCACMPEMRLTLRSRWDAVRQMLVSGSFLRYDEETKCFWRRVPVRLDVKTAEVQQRAFGDAVKLVHSTIPREKKLAGDIQNALEDSRSNLRLVVSLADTYKRESLGVSPLKPTLPFIELLVDCAWHLLENGVYTTPSQHEKEPYKRSLKHEKRLSKTPPDEPDVYLVKVLEIASSAFHAWEECAQNRKVLAKILIVTGSMWLHRGDFALSKRYIDEALELIKRHDNDDSDEDTSENKSDDRDKVSNEDSKDGKEAVEEEVEEDVKEDAKEDAKEDVEEDVKEDSKDSNENHNDDSSKDDKEALTILFTASNIFGNIATSTGRVNRAIKEFEQLQTRIEEATNDPTPHTLTQFNLGRALLYAGKTAQASAKFYAALVGFGNMENWAMLAFALFAQAGLYRQEGNLPMAKLLYEQARVAFTKQGGHVETHMFVGACLYKAGCVEFDMGAVEKADSSLRRALDIASAHKAEMTGDYARTMLKLAVVQQRLAAPNRANRGGDAGAGNPRMPTGTRAPAGTISVEASLDSLVCCFWR